MSSWIIRTLRSSDECAFEGDTSDRHDRFTHGIVERGRRGNGATNCMDLFQGYRWQSIGLDNERRRTSRSTA